MHALHDGFVQACIFQIYVFCRGGNHTSVCPWDEACAALIKAVALQFAPFRRRDVRYAHMAAVAEEQRERVKLRIEHQMIACEAADAEAVFAHVRRHLAQPLKRMLCEAEESEQNTIEETQKTEGEN